ncbi:MAG TPA: BamA/TamA family outer membrane protein, partial [Longimicrobiaceae bacterium]|nr:BamA/TamA family outer membrane protein [Longimicrobiaceae bacterium]
ADVTASAYLTAPVATEPTLALRAGGRRAWGAFPLQEAAFVGGSGSLRGYPEQRFAGEGAVFANAELRVPLAPVNLGVRGEVGALALADAGRVFAEGESSSRWHTAYGGGVWASFLGRSRTFGVSYARGDAGRIYLWSGFPF